MASRASPDSASVAVVPCRVRIRPRSQSRRHMVHARSPRNPTIRGKLRAADAILTAEAPSAITRGSDRRGDGPDLAVGGNATRQEESHINNSAFNAAATASSTASASSLSTKAKASAATSARRSARSRIASRWSTQSQASTRARGSTMLGRSTTRRSTPRRRNRLGPAEALVLEPAAFGRNRCRWRTRPPYGAGSGPSMRLAQPDAKRRGAGNLLSSARSRETTA
jgi:hypothetical protein